MRKGFEMGALPPNPWDLPLSRQDIFLFPAAEKGRIPPPPGHLGLRVGARGRGRDEHRCPPPAQIRTSGITAYGSSLGYERRSVRRDRDEEGGDEESTGRR